jgi:cytochrome c
LIYLLTDAYGKGRILRLHPGAPSGDARIAKSLFESSTDEAERRKGAPLALAQKTYSEARAVYRYDPDKSAQAFAQFCAGCHAFDRFTFGHVGPDLNGIDGRHSGTLAGYAYSAALTDPAHQLVWSDRTLFGFLQQPQVYFPGTAMSVPSLPATTVQQIVDFLTKGMMGRGQRRDTAETEPQSNRPLLPNREDSAR